MRRNGVNAFCCGGGGGNFFTDILGGGENSANRVRVREALGTGAPIIAVACPSCAKMLTDLLAPFTNFGKVVEGAKRGHRLGFPTANLAISDELYPKAGVYAVEVLWNHQPSTEWPTLESILHSGLNTQD
jgi:Fe-S oxidoreductase